MNDSQKTEKLSTIKEFLFKDYDFCYNINKNTIEFSDRWFKFFIATISAVSSFLIYIFTKYPPEVMKVLEQNSKVKEVLEKYPKVKEVLEQQNILLFGESSFRIAGLLVLVLFLMGLVILLLEARGRRNLTENIRAINRIRRYFVNEFTTKGFRFDRYLYHYHVDDKPKVFGWTKESCIKCVIISLINSVILAGAIFLFFQPTAIYYIISFVIVFVFQVLAVIYLQKHWESELNKKVEFPEDWQSTKWRSNLQRTNK